MIYALTNCVVISAIVDPIYDVPLEQRPNRYFEFEAPVAVDPDGTFVVHLGKYWFQCIENQSLETTPA
jgi:hypothetical protein